LNTDEQGKKRRKQHKALTLTNRQNKNFNHKLTTPILFKKVQKFGKHYLRQLFQKEQTTTGKKTK
tara:strand:+ start:14570 stop:14764 length:195 start_codon:yes stop_codon:yes gene_type:complete